MRPCSFRNHLLLLLEVAAAGCYEKAPIDSAKLLQPPFMTLPNRLEPRISPQAASAAALGSQLSNIPLPPPVPPGPQQQASPPDTPGPRAHSFKHQSHFHETAGKVELRGGWTPPEPSRYDLTAPGKYRELFGFCPLPSPAPSQTISASAAFSTQIEKGGHLGALGKRPSEGEKSGIRPYQSPSKKPRLVAPGNITLPPLPQTVAELAAGLPDITSPLFFSRSSEYISPRPTSFRASDISASMMGGTHETNDRVTTLRLPKGQVTTASPSRTSSTPGSWSSAEPTDSSRSPEGRSHPGFAPLLQGIGVVELLEQDERPTFIVDLTNAANFTFGPLHIIYVNASLRVAQGILELLQTDTADLSHSPEFANFKAWVLKNNEPSDLYLPSLSYGGVKWTCSTLRRRFRVVSGSTSAASVTPTTPSPLARVSSVPVLDEGGSRGTRRPGHPNSDPSSPQPAASGDVDYFGAAGAFDLSSSTRPRAHSEPSSKPDTIIDTSFPFSDDDLPLIAPLSAQLQTTFDWTRIPLDDPNLGAHHRFARSIDWASTPLGPVEYWPSDLRIMSNLIMGSPHPAAMYWGKEYVAIYNEAYISLAGQKHPKLMGSRYMDAWSEIWDELEPVFDGAWNDGDAMMKHDDGLFLTRHGFLEETFFNWAIIPMVGGDGTVVALYNPAFENTRRKINERRMLTLREIGVKTSQARDVKGFWGQVKAGLEYNELDVPFALIYSVSDDSESESASMTSGSLSNPPQIVLEGSLGVPDGHPTAVTSIDLRTSDEGFAPFLRDSMSHTADPIVLSEKDGTLPRHLIEGLTFRGFGDPCQTIVVFPVHPTTAVDMVVGFIVIGVNPRRPYDDDYKLFVNLLSRQLATSMASVVLFEEEIKRGQRAARLAALDRQELSMQLHLRTQEAVESEYRFTRMAEFGPVGLFIADGHGHINYCNEMWWKISGHERHTSTLDGWMQSVREDDRPGVEDAWRRIVEEKTAVTHEFRFKGSRQIIDGHSVDTWALMSAYPEKDEAGDLKSIFGCITDISQQKWAEDFQKKARDEAVELKRQQESKLYLPGISHHNTCPNITILNLYYASHHSHVLFDTAKLASNNILMNICLDFIDITSHEMRNPLSAILQCADEISSSLHQYKIEDPFSQAPGALNLLIDNCVEAANTISLCAGHQKRIVDDILTLSKLDSNLLLVTPVDVQPITVVQNVIKMFEAELNSNEITGDFRIEDSYRELQVDWVKLDPSRLRQVLINLMTNAIKFTQGRPLRRICISLGASTEKIEPELSMDVLKTGVSYFPPRHPDQQDLTDDADWADGEKINLHLAVSDTGPGLDDDEKKILFQRFSQASPRTHVQYGGSGLGLFICRILTELQGGQIGVQSSKGEGSTFAFYVKSRRTEHPTEPDPSVTVPTPRPSPPKPMTRPQAHAISHLPEQLPSSLTPVPRSSGKISPVSPAHVRDTSSAKSLDVLIVEDNLVNQRVLQRQLQLSGNNTFVANHGGEALEELRRSRFWNVEAAAASASLQSDKPLWTGSAAGSGAVATERSSEVERDDEQMPDSGEEATDKKNISVILMDLEMPVMDGMSCTREIRRLENAGVITRHIPIIAVTAYARPEQIENAKAAGVVSLLLVLISSWSQ